MNYIFRSVGYEQYDSFSNPAIIAELEIRPDSTKERRDIHKLINSTSYKERQNLESIFNSRSDLPNIKNVYFNNPVTVVLWDDGTKTLVRCQDGDTYSRETGLALCVAKKAMGNNGKFNDIFHKWIPEEKKVEPKKKQRQKGCINCIFGDDGDNPICWDCDADYSNWEPAE